MIWSGFTLSSVEGKLAQPTLPQFAGGAVLKQALYSSAALLNPTMTPAPQQLYVATARQSASLSQAFIAGSHAPALSRHSMVLPCPPLLALAEPPLLALAEPPLLALAEPPLLALAAPPLLTERAPAPPAASLPADVGSGLVAVPPFASELEPAAAPPLQAPKPNANPIALVNCVRELGIPIITSWRSMFRASGSAGICPGIH